ncbi:hypothetical protein O6H91_04G030300 [Diphasiastrum complanatum]|uniref:Uncharacterized protein n=2 Tax=Diphasiastrum complanatum TaxID=34168 RepID=A0ACC2DVI0_DIPCM|nr:hypothetical protein O6H91_04G030300 [Diphasiastrum complanatum]KAJ7558245.1 hypothetical protein O6H91_04G030300 [Diphasiastrum complanatum]
MAGRNMRSSSASTSFPSNFSSAGGRIFASQKWENEIPLKFQREIRQVAVEQPIMPDGRDPGYRSNEQRPDFPWRGTEPFQGNDEALSSYARRADGATGWQSGVGRGRGGRWNGNFVAESGYRASGERLAREQHTGNRAVSGALVEKNRGAPVRIEDGWGKEYSPRGRDGHKASGNAYIQQVASSPSGYSSPISSGFNKSYQRRTADEQVITRGVRSWKKEERGVAASQETRTRIAHQSKWQKEKLLDSLNESETVGHEQVGMIRTGTNCDPREQTTVPAAITSYEEVPCNTSSNFATGDHIQVLPMIVYRRSMIESNFEEASLPSIIGTCQDMCPAAEREMRQRLRDLAVFERLNGNQGKTSRELAVKKFCRNFSIKDLQQQDVRPFSVLSQTMNNLLRFLDDCDYSYVAVYDFLFDRTRAIRQELGMQRIIHKHAVTIYENLVRFHILSEHILHGESSFNSHLNLEQLSKALISLPQPLLYQYKRLWGTKSFT